jgi:hypothetical protein
VEFQPVLEVESPEEGERACGELRAHGIECSWVREPPSPTGLKLGARTLRDFKLPRLYVVVPEEEADRATVVLQAAWEAAQRGR